MKSSTITAVAVCAAAIGFGQSAAAASITITYDEPLIASDSSVGVDVFGALSISEEGQASVGGPDGHVDFFLNDFFGVGRADGFLVLGGDLEPGERPGDLEERDPSTFASVGFATDAIGVFRNFAAGEDVSAHDPALWAPFGLLYDGATGPLASVGDQGFFGFRVEFLRETLVDVVFNEDCIDAEVTPPECFGGGRLIEVVGSFYGYMDITRGSVELNAITFANQSGESVIVSEISPVPLPAGALLLLGGLGGLAAFRRKS